jgi:hypothetical protein
MSGPIEVVQGQVWSRLGCETNKQTLYANWREIGSAFCICPISLLKRIVWQMLIVFFFFICVPIEYCLRISIHSFREFLALEVPRLISALRDENLKWRLSDTDCTKTGCVK